MADQSFKEIQQEAQRCYGCGVPFCQTGETIDGKVFGCPLHNLIPEWNHMLASGHIDEAVNRLLKSNCFPEITGRVCPAFCQQVCIHRDVDKKPIQNRATERFLAEYAFEHALIKPLIAPIHSGYSIGIIGSGPMGLAAAHYLSARGHTVTIYEKEAILGGGLRTRVSQKKLPSAIIDRRLALLEEQGVQFHTNESVDEEALQGRYTLTINAAVEKQNPYVAFAIQAGKQAAADAERMLLGYTNLL